MRCDGNEDDVEETVGEMLKSVGRTESLLTSVSGKVVLECFHYR